MYADGAISTSYSSTYATAHGSPISIVFYTSPSTYDQNLGYTHGYAMALKSYNNRTSLDNWCASSLQSTQVTDTFVTTLNGVRSDMDGLKHCKTAYTYIDTNGGSYSDLTAIYAAISGYESEVSAPSSTSGWYLPSIGQQYSWLQAAKSDVYTGSESWNDLGTSWSRSDESTVAAGYMNTWLAGVGLTASTHYEEFINGSFFWSSTERVAEYPFYFKCHTSGPLILGSNNDKSYEGSGVRAVLAF